MPLPTTLRRRPRRTLRLVASACLVVLAAAVAALLASGPAAPQATAASTQPCLLLCPTPTPTATRSPTARPTATPRPTATHSSPPSTPNPTPLPPAPPPPDYVPPSFTPYPTLPPPSPGSPPQPPALAVQAIALQLASLPAGGPGGQVLVQATLVAQRGTDLYSVPHAAVTFSISSQPGAGAFVDPPQLDSSDTGVAVVTVQTSDTPGDTVLHAASGTVSADFTVHTGPATPKPSPSARHTPAIAVAVSSGINPGGGSRPMMIAGLSALLAAMAGAYAAALVLGRLPNPLQRRVWGRRQSR
jgi:hypothetical protein